MSAMAKAVPRATPELAPFFEGARKGELRVQRCSACGALRFPAREVCAHCWSRRSEWQRVSGRGEVYSFYWMHQLYHPAFADEIPYAVAVIELEEGPRITTNVIGCSHDELRIGLPVEVTFEQRSDEVSLPQFRPRS